MVCHLCLLCIRPHPRQTGAFVRQHPRENETVREQRLSVYILSHVFHAQFPEKFLISGIISFRSTSLGLSHFCPLVMAPTTRSARRRTAGSNNGPSGPATNTNTPATVFSGMFQHAHSAGLFVAYSNLTSGQLQLGRERTQEMRSIRPPRNKRPRQPMR